jgi:hypothetical protein
MSTNKGFNRAFEFLPPRAASPAAVKMGLSAPRIPRSKLSIQLHQYLLIGKMGISIPHKCSPFRNARHAAQGSRQRKRYRAEGHIEDRGDFPIPQSFRPQEEASAVLLG